MPGSRNVDNGLIVRVGIAMFATIVAGSWAGPVVFNRCSEPRCAEGQSSGYTKCLEDGQRKKGPASAGAVPGSEGSSVKARKK